MHVCTLAYGDPQSALKIFLYDSQYSLRQCLSLNLKFIYLARLTDQQVSGVLLSLPSLAQGLQMYTMYVEIWSRVLNAWDQLRTSIPALYFLLGTVDSTASAFAFPFMMDCISVGCESKQVLLPLSYFWLDIWSQRREKKLMRIYRTSWESGFFSHLSWFWDSYMLLYATCFILTYNSWAILYHTKIHFSILLLMDVWINVLVWIFRQAWFCFSWVET